MKLSQRPREVSGLARRHEGRTALELRVHEVCQTSSGGSHVTIYEADIDLAPGEVAVEVASVYPAGADPDTVSSAWEAIRAGRGRDRLRRAGAPHGEPQGDELFLGLVPR